MTGARKALRASALVLGMAGLATFSLAGTASADPEPAITSPSAGYTNVASPLFEGTGADTEEAVIVAVRRGTGDGGPEAEEALVAVVDEGRWSVQSAQLPDGTYTAVAYQESAQSSPVTFTVDTEPPVVKTDVPASFQTLHRARVAFEGEGGTEPGDVRTVLLQVWSAEEGAEAPVETLSAPVAPDRRWQVEEQGLPLANGHYYVIAEQRDEAGNVGYSKRVDFTVEADSPAVTLSAAGLVSRQGSWYADATPSFSGAAQSALWDSATITLRLYAVESGAPLQPVAVASAQRDGTEWHVGPLGPLADGVYTVQAEQSSLTEETGFSEPLTFTVDADAPNPSISAPAPGGTVGTGALDATGTAGTAPGDEAAVTVLLYAGDSTGGSPTETVSVPSSAGAWSAPLGTLASGTYTLEARQRDDVGNTGTSAPVTFSVAAPAPPAPPTASFSWYPAVPHVGETVSIVSTSSDRTSAIVGYSWSLLGNGIFQPGGQTVTTTFTTPGQHVVELSVVDAAGTTSKVAKTIVVKRTPIGLMQPFPVVRIAGTESSAGTRIRLLTVQAPVGAWISIVCDGRRCPVKKASAYASASKGKHPAGSTVVEFHRLERLLSPGTVLEIEVSKAGEIGKFTRFVARAGKLPTREDICLSTSGKPMACPSA